MTSPPLLRDALQRDLGTTYAIERELSAGGMARVFLATETRLGRRVVIKVLASEQTAGLSAERFEREIALAARLQHPHIVPVLAAGEAGGLPYYVMPYVAGESLRARLSAGAALTIQQAVTILRDVAKALQFAHEQGIVHRDIKPENVLLAGGSAVVTDFGIAKAIAISRTAAGVPGGGAPGLASGITAIGTSLGTPAYMSPEQAAGDPDVDHRSDIYSFGVLAYELLAGAHPFPYQTPHQLIAAHIGETPAPVRTHRPDVPPALDALVMRCLEKSAERRPRSAAEVLSTLDMVGTSSGESAATHARKRGRIIIAAAAALLLIGVLVVVPRTWPAFRGAAPASAPALGPTAADSVPSVAVLPMVNVGGEAQGAYFADGMTDELTVALQKVPGLRVASRASAFTLRDKQLPLDSVAKLLNVTTVLGGSVRREGNRLRISAELTNASDGRVLWSDRFERSARDVFAVQDDITRAIVAALRVQLVRGAEAGALKGTSDLQAYDYYLRGLYAFQKRGVANMRQATQDFTAATLRDPAFARAWAGLANVLSQLPSWTGSAPDSIAGPALRAAERAIALDSTLAEPHAVLGFLHRYNYDWDRSEAEFQRAMSLDPRSPVVLQWYGELLYGMGRSREAVAILRRAHDVDPLYTLPLITLAHAYALNRQFAESEQACRRAIALDPSNPLTRFVYGNMLLWAGRPSEGLEQLKSSALAIPIPDALGGVAVGFAMTGQRAQADSVIRVLRGMETRPGAYTPIAIAYGALGDTTRLFAYLERAATTHEFSLLRLGPGAPAFDVVRNTPHYRAIVHRMGLDRWVK